MNPILKISLLICLTGAVSATAFAQSQTRTYYDSVGRNTGRSVSNGSGTTTFYDNVGRNTGRAVTNPGSGTTTFYDNVGRQTGTARK